MCMTLCATNCGQPRVDYYLGYLKCCISVQLRKIMVNMPLKCQDIFARFCAVQKPAWPVVILYASPTSVLSAKAGYFDISGSKIDTNLKLFEQLVICKL